MNDDLLEVATGTRNISVRELSRMSGLPTEYILSEYKRLIAAGKSMTIADLQAKYEEDSE